MGQLQPSQPSARLLHRAVAAEPPRSGTAFGQNGSGSSAERRRLEGGYREPVRRRRPGRVPADRHRPAEAAAAVPNRRHLSPFPLSKRFSANMLHQFWEIGVMGRWRQKGIGVEV